MSAALESERKALYARGRRAHPDVAVPFDAFVVEPGAEHGEDLYLATGARRGDAAAIAKLDAQFIAPLARQLRAARIRTSADDVLQRLRERLLLRDGKLAKYSGKGALAAWLRLVALRLGRELDEVVRPAVSLDEGDVAALATDPELKVLRSRHGALFRGAVESALGSLEAAERNMLKLYFLDGLASDAIAAMFGVDGSTVRRRLAGCKKRIVATVRGRLKDELRLESAELQSLLRQLGNDFGASISRVLKAP